MEPTISWGRRSRHPHQRMSPQPARILLVDDEQSVQKLLAYPLRKEGYEVVPALDGEEALERCRGQSFDLIVLDVMLPKLDGFDVCRQIRAQSSVPIIMLTAKAEEFDKVLGLELGADDYITKPFSMREFRSRVKAVLRRSDLLREEQRDEEPLAAGDLTIDFAKRTVEIRERARAAHLRGVRDPLDPGAQPRPRVQPHDDPRPPLGRLLLPRPAHDRRPHQAPAREDRDATRRIRSSSSPCAGWGTTSETDEAAAATGTLARQQAGAGVLRDHRGRVRGHLLLSSSRSSRPTSSTSA